MTAPKVLFVCVSNNGKSVMAERIMRHVVGERVGVSSAGTHAKRGVNAQSVNVLAEIGVDISGHQAAQLTDDLAAAADLVVVLGTQAHVESADTPIEVWDTTEPLARGIEGIDRMRLIRDDIAARVTELAIRLNEEHTPQQS